MVCCSYNALGAYSFFITHMAHEKEEKTLIILKPDAVHRGIMGEVIRRFERKGLKVVGMKMMQLEDAMLEAHYAHIADKPFFGGIKTFMKTSPVVVMALSVRGTCRNDSW